jgi:hypothetical protein
MHKIKTFVLVILAISLFGCATGKTPSQVVDENKPTLDAYESQYLDCMKSYGASHATSDATPRDIAEAAQANCQESLNTYESFYGKVLSQIRSGETYVNDPYGQARNQAVSLSVLGRQITIKSVIETRGQSPTK